MNTLTGLQCPECGEEFEADVVETVCESCDSPLLARYDLAHPARALQCERVSGRPAGLWRWADLLPVRDPEIRYMLGEVEEIFACFEGAAPLAGLEVMVKADDIESDDRVVLFNTGHGMKYLS